MKLPLISLLFICTCLQIFANLLSDAPFHADATAKQWTFPAQSQRADGVLSVNSDTQSRAVLAVYSSSISEIAGRILRLTGEVKGENLRPGPQKYSGGKLMFELKYPGRTHWNGVALPSGDFDWKKIDQVISVKPELESGRLLLGLERASGTIRFRNLKLEILGTPLDLRSAANRPLADNSKGIRGWSGQGPANDGSRFRSAFTRKEFAHIPFELIPDGKSVLVLNSERIENCPDHAVLRITPAAHAANFYLLHTLSWAPATGTIIGELTLTGDTGKEQQIPIQVGREVADWWMPQHKPNGAVAIRAPNASGENTGLYLSKFTIDPTLGAVRQVRFRLLDGKTIWIIAGATLTTTDHPLPDPTPFTVKAGREYQAYERSAHNQRLAGSALDVSGYLPREKSGAHGRVIVNRAGHFAFADRPEQPVRFFCCAIQSPFASRTDIEKTMQELRKNGYNMIRTHFLDNQLMANRKNDLDFDPERLDLFDYMIFQMKENGLYLNFDAMTSWLGYTPGNCWAAADKNGKKYTIYFDPASRENWRKGVAKLLTRVNPYTHTRLIDDPTLAMIVGFNEQEFAFVRPFDGSAALAEWRAFLRQRYGTFAQWRATHTGEAPGSTDFETLPMFTAATANGDDATAFIRSKELEMLHFYRDSLREMGYRGPVTNYNMGKSLHYNLVRSEADFSAINNYHAHPTASGISQRSSIATAGGVFRNIMATRPSDKPLIVTEHNHVFWNRYRYEQAFVTGCYAAFQAIDGLTAHAAPVSLDDRSEIRSFRLYADPIATASEFLTFFAFMRGDVAPARHAVRINVNGKELDRAAAARSSLSEAQSKLALLTGFSVATGMEAGKQPPRSGELLLSRKGGARVETNQAGFAAAVDDGTPANDLVDLLKKSRILPPGNRSNGNNRFESETGELLLDTNRNYMAVNTPRLQGICAEGGSTAKLNDLEILEMSVSGNLAVVSVDALKPLREADRMVLVYATNALNSGMEFENADMATRLNNGHLPILLQRGKLRIALQNRNAATLKLYTLAPSGERLKRIEPESVENGRVIFALDTAREASGVFFEIAREKQEK